eukprot:CAMPEP_0180645552 /NCGR_PEP_ID=MMETSP1037_2-20121125/49063_1 /TAXON_ID=632150 /ORGANISM="Azadinium spinosum, Strain 3D9" /LENGTH=118 /DNA_ID=CAMNT_0022669443 /DNA_START=177 /DNA_END=533 /DNA_ORIENTATION=+
MTSRRPPVMPQFKIFIARVSWVLYHSLYLPPSRSNLAFIHGWPFSLSDVKQTILELGARAHACCHIKGINDKDILPLRVRPQEAVEKEVAHVIDAVQLVEVREVDAHKLEGAEPIAVD